MDTPRTLLLLRHAETESFAPGRRDAERQLTPRGHAQARALGDWLRAEGFEIDHVVCSPATRTRQTLDELALDGARTSVELSRDLYEAGSDTVLRLVAELEDAATTVLLVGHAPGIPAAALELADPTTSDHTALDTVGTRYPPATVSVLQLDGPWASASSAALRVVRLA